MKHAYEVIEITFKQAVFYTTSEQKKPVSCLKKLKGALLKDLCLWFDCILLNSYIKVKNTGVTGFYVLMYADNDIHCAKFLFYIWKVCFTEMHYFNIVN